MSASPGSCGPGASPLPCQARVAPSTPNEPWARGLLSAFSRGKRALRGEGPDLRGRSARMPELPGRPVCPVWDQGPRTGRRNQCRDVRSGAVWSSGSCTAWRSGKQTGPLVDRCDRSRSSRYRRSCCVFSLPRPPSPVPSLWAARGPARTHALPAPYRAAAAGLPTLADPRHDSAGSASSSRASSHPGGQEVDLTARTRPCNPCIDLLRKPDLYCSCLFWMQPR
jgi:hypothetical protein